MSTRSFIAIRQADKSLKGVYCHFDGYLEHNGALLLDHYQDRGKVERLIELGDLSSLAERLDPDPGSFHSFDMDQRQPGVCVFYGRDRGEEDVRARIITLADAKKSWCEYLYIYEQDGTWNYYDLNEKKLTLRSVQAELAKLYQKYGFSRPKGHYGFQTQKSIAQFRDLEARAKEQKTSCEPGQEM